MITIGFAPHYVETLSFARDQMERSDIIILEEPPSPHFLLVLNGDFSIDGYVREIDSAFPEFGKTLYSVLRELHSQGKRITQVEPYLEKLHSIHERFGEGKTPDDVLAMPKLRDVYQIERQTTGALLSYYDASSKAPFETVVEAVNRFARIDATRINFRAKLRAEAIKAIYISGKSAFVEAGCINYPLYRFLSHALMGVEKVRSHFLLAPVIKRLKGKRRSFGPGNILTLHYMYHNTINGDLARLLAARSLIYVKIIQKEELLPGTSDFPHTEDETKINHVVDLLNYQDCRAFFSQIRRKNRVNSFRLAEDYLEKKS